MSQQVSIEILEPSGILESPHREGLFAPRLDDLNGKTIALMSINIPMYFGTTSDPFFDAVEKKLKERYPEVKILRMNSFGTPIDPPEKALEVAKLCDAWLEGVKDAHSQGRHDAGACMEKAGKPGVSICVDVLRRAKAANQDISGVPNVRIVTVPAVEYAAGKEDPECMDKVAGECIDEIAHDSCQHLIILRRCLLKLFSQSFQNGCHLTMHRNLCLASNEILDCIDIGVILSGSSTEDP